MDSGFESGLLAIVDEALASKPTVETFTHLRQTYTDFSNEGEDRATEHVKHLLSAEQLLNLPPEYKAALDEQLPPERSAMFTEVGELLAWTLWDGSPYTDQDRADGYRTVPEFFQSLREWRARYRDRFDR